MSRAYLTGDMTLSGTVCRGKVRVRRWTRLKARQWPLICPGGLAWPEPSVGLAVLGMLHQSLGQLLVTSILPANKLPSALHELREILPEGTKAVLEAGVVRHRGVVFVLRESIHLKRAIMRTRMTTRESGPGYCNPI